MSDPADLAAEFEAMDATGGELSDANYNVAPTNTVPAVVTRHPRGAEGAADPDRTERSIRALRWGLLPHWAKDAGAGAKMINARAESVHSKPAFRAALAKRRCVLPAAGWFEWHRDVDSAGRAVKQPFFMTPPDGRSIPMAGIWSTWRDPNAAAGAPLVVSCAVLTTAAAGGPAGIHDRMPLLLPRDALAAWMDPDSDDVADLLASPDTALAGALELRPVSVRVNSVRNNDADLLAPVGTGATAGALFDVDAASR